MIPGMSGERPKNESFDSLPPPDAPYTAGAAKPPGEAPRAADTDPDVGAGLLAAEARRTLAPPRRVDEAPRDAHESPRKGGGGGGLLWRVLVFIVLPWAAVLALAAVWQYRRNAERYVLAIEGNGPPPESRPGTWLWVRHGVGLFGTEAYAGRAQFDPVALPPGTVLARTEMQYETDLTAELRSVLTGLAEKMLEMPGGAGTESARVYAARARLLVPLPRDTDAALKRLEAEIALRDARRLVDSVGPTLAAARKALSGAGPTARFDEIAELQSMIASIERVRAAVTDATTGDMPAGAAARAGPAGPPAPLTAAPAAPATARPPGPALDDDDDAADASGSAAAEAPASAPGVSPAPETPTVVCPPCVCECAPGVVAPAPAPAAPAAPAPGPARAPHSAQPAPAPATGRLL